jgi:hypothetical protein
LNKKEQKRRSIWREMAFFVFIVKSNLIPLKNIINEFTTLNNIFLVEKRIKKRQLQLTNTT